MPTSDTEMRHVPQVGIVRVSKQIPQATWDIQSKAASRGVVHKDATGCCEERGKVGSGRLPE